MKDLREYILESIEEKQVLESSNPVADELHPFLDMLFAVAEKEIGENQLNEIVLSQGDYHAKGKDKIVAKGFKKNENGNSVAAFMNELNTTLEHETEDHIWISWPNEIGDKYFGGTPAMSAGEIIKDMKKFDKLDAEYQKILKNQK